MKTKLTKLSLTDPACRQTNVIPAKAGIQGKFARIRSDSGFPIGSGMTSPPRRASHTTLKFLCIKSSAFTLLEVLIAITLFGLVMAGTIEVYIICNKLWRATSLSMETSRMASLAIQRMVYGYGTNCGLRSATTITFANAHGHPYPTPSPVPDAYKYWETGATPPAASDVNYYTCTGTVSGAYLPDGSWRLSVSNAYEGVKYIDYNIKTRNILFWPNISSKSTRISVCNYVSAATAIVNNVNGTVEIHLTVWKKDGMFVSSNQVSMVVKKRNN